MQTILGANGIIGEELAKELKGRGASGNGGSITPELSQTWVADEYAVLASHE